MLRHTRTIPNVARLIDGLDVGRVRQAIQEEYSAVAMNPDQGFHFHTGRTLTRLLGYEDSWLDPIPQPTIASFAGTGNPFSLGPIRQGEGVVDVGCGAGGDSLIASRMVGPDGEVFLNRPALPSSEQSGSTSAHGSQRPKTNGSATWLHWCV